uniref:Hemocyanin D chain n=1 Tax=Aphonopelma sp. TaxID=29932 RepID=HCYD_APHSP|nr:RecName: Full=Hemocyanin D chain; Short=HcD [Aphonopelma sp.]CAB89499.1 hemocyanin subunit d [Aphonopelma californicum (nom. dub.)]
MTIADHQARILPLFKKLTSLSPDPLPEAERDPRLKGVGFLPRGTLFSCFHEEHLAEAETLAEALVEAKNFDDFIALATNARAVVNEGLYAFAMSVAILSRDDCNGVVLPPIQEVFPDRFVPAETINRALKVDKVSDPNKDTVVPIQKTGNIRDPEYNVAYFREDIGINSHHWHWHLVYPAFYDADIFGKIKDRKGELFYYMHQQMCARYDCERLSVGLQRMIPFQNLDDELEGYSPHLRSLVSGLSYGSRPAGMHLRDINDCSVQDMERWRERILDAIHTGLVTDSHGKEIKLTEENGLNILGALIESSHDSVNKPFYGTLHNWGHVMIARIHDADGRYRTNPGVMDDTSTSLRDPIFYRYHRWMDNIFQEYKHRLPSYTHQQLDFPGVRISRVTVRSKVPNLIHTYSKDSLLELSHGINLKGHIQVKYEHLDHEPYNYEIEVDNRTGEARETCVRIFLAPKYDELGNRLILEEQRRLYIELDKFHRRLEPGKNVLVRASGDSSVTLSKVPTFEELESGNANVNPNEYCSCGWPEHMLVPRGKERGMDFYLFVMLTDYEEDKVQGAGEQTICSDAVSYCGAKDQKYPDKKAMGYPFDRPIQVRTPSQFKTPNMAFQEIIIQYEGHKH